jgi:hypothetical protein
MGRPEPRAVARLDLLLAQERLDLREGRYDRLKQFDRDKIAFVESLARSGFGEDVLRAVRAELDRNHRLRESARDGLRAAQATRAGEPAALRTYGPDGQPGQGAPSGNRLARRV